MVHYLTKKKLAELEEELQDYKTEKRKDVAERLKKAKELGDLSENSEYMEAREEQERVERHIQRLEETIRNCELIKMTKGSDVICLGSTFTAEKGDSKMELTIVGVDETNPEEGFISNESPMGQAFLGKAVGDTVKIETPAGKSTYKIKKIS